MYYNIVKRRFEVNDPDYVFTGLYFGLSLGLYLKEKRRRRKALMKKLYYMAGGFNIEFAWADCGNGYDIRTIELILESGTVKVKIVTFIVNFFALYKHNIIKNIKLLILLLINMSAIYAYGMHPIVIVMISGVVGLALSCLPVIGSYFAPRAILAMFLWRSGSQMISHMLLEVFSLITEILNFISEPYLRKRIEPGLFTKGRPPLISSKPKIKLLTSPEILKVLQKFEILQQKLPIDTLDSDPDLEKLFEMSKHEFSPKGKAFPVAKSVYFKNFIKETVDVDNLSNLSITNAEIVQQAAKSQLKAD
jgi:hypothetical protein